MSGDCSCIAVTTPHVSPSRPNFAFVYPTSVTVDRTTAGMSTQPRVVISPETMTRPVVTRVSHATLEPSSTRSIASRIASEILSASLSGCPSVTDSDEKRYEDALMSRASLAAGSDARPARLEERRQAAADRLGQLGLGPSPKRNVVAPRLEQHRLVRLRAEARSLPAHLIHHDEVEALRRQLLPAGRLQVVGLGGEADEHLFGGSLAQLAEDVGRGFEDHLGHAGLLLQLGLRDRLGTEVRDGRRHHDRIGTIEPREHRVAHLLRGLDRDDLRAC